MMYEFKCPLCDNRVEMDTRFAPSCGLHDSRMVAPQMVRVWSFQAAPVWQEHQNTTTGTVISDPRQFERELRDMSDKATQRNGIPHSYVPADHSDMDKLGVTGEGLDETARRVHDTQL